MRREGGFTLLEILVAIAIFTFVAAAAGQTMASADYLTASGKRARELRMLAERRLGEVLSFEGYWDDKAPYEGDFADYGEYKDQFKDWKWQVDIRDVTAFGVSTAENAEYLFGAPTDDEKAQAAQQSGGGSASGAGSSGTTTQKVGKPQELREITLRVLAPTDQGPGDSVELIVFASKIAAKAAGAKAGG